MEFDEERHRSREFVAFLQRLDAAYPPATAIAPILDNHSAHAWRPVGTAESRPEADTI
jgi:hypothetical protein